MTRFYKNVFNNRFREINSKTRYLQQNILSMLSLSLMGFLSGNLFGTFLPSLRKFVVWDGFIIACLLIVSEMISYFSYNPIKYRLSIDRHYKPEARRGRWQSHQKKFSRERGFAKTKFSLSPNGFAWWRSHLPLQAKPLGLMAGGFATKNVCKNFNIFKIGVITGFFVDAFKVGS